VKKRIVVLLVIMLIALTGYVYADVIDVSVNGDLLVFDVSPVIDQGRTLVPLRAIFEKLGAEIEWDGTTQTITATKEKKVIELQIGQKNATLNGNEVVLDVPAKIVNGRTMVPVRFVSEAMDSVVDWNNDTRTVIIRAAKILNKIVTYEETWTKEDSPYVLTQKFTLKNDGKIIIEPGVEIYVEPETLAFFGQIEAKGTADMPIKFYDRLGINNELYIRKDDSIFEHCIIDSNLHFEKADGSQVLNSKVNQIEVDASSNMIIDNNTLSGGIFGIHVYYGDNVIIKNNKISDAGKGISFKNVKEAEVSKNSIVDCEYGIYSNSNYNSKIWMNDISKSSKFGLFVDKASTGNEYYYNNFTENVMNAKVDISVKTINLFDNYWGTHKAEIVEEKLFDKDDNPELPEIIYEPFLTEPYSE